MSGSALVYGAFSDYLEKALLHHVFGGAAYTRPAGLWVALYTTMASDTGPGSEPPTAGGYARQPVTFVDTSDQPDGSSAMYNPSIIVFPAASAPWGTVTWAGIHDAVSGGNMLAQGPLAAAKPVDIGDAVQFPAHQLMIGLQ